MRVFTHLEHQLPKIADVVREYGSNEFFKTAYGLDAQGEPISEAHRQKLLKKDDDDDEDQGGASDDHAETQMIISKLHATTEQPGTACSFASISSQTAFHCATEMPDRKLNGRAG